MAQAETKKVFYETNKSGSMKQASVSKYGGPDVFEIQELAIPAPKGDEILVEIKAAGVNWADAMRRAGTYFEHEPFPYVLGAEAAGVVVAVGPEVKNYKNGDRVLGFVGIGAYSQYIAKSETSFSPLPEGVSFAESTALLAQGLSAYLMLTDVVNTHGKTILIEGAAGGVGSLMIQIARSIGMEKIVALASSEEKRQLSINLGADIAIASDASDLTEQIKKATDGKGVDVYYEMAGRGEEAMKSLGDFGTLVVYGNANLADVKIEVGRSDDALTPLKHNHTIRGFYIGGYFHPSHIHIILDAVKSLGELVATGKVKIAVEKYPLSEVVKVHEDLEARKTTGKVVIEPWA
jgi:NADPH2:quinone reductase